MRSGQGRLCLSDCQDFPCKRIATLGSSESTLIHDGQRMKEIGLEAWMVEQEQRRQAGFCYADVLMPAQHVPESHGPERVAAGIAEL